MHSQMCITGGNFRKNHIFWKDLLQPSKPGRGRELTKDRPFIHMYIGLCKFCHPCHCDERLRQKKGTVMPKHDAPMRKEKAVRLTMAGNVLVEAVP